MVNVGIGKVGKSRVSERGIKMWKRKLVNEEEER